MQHLYLVFLGAGIACVIIEECITRRLRRTVGVPLRQLHRVDLRAPWYAKTLWRMGHVLMLVGWVVYFFG